MRRMKSARAAEIEAFEEAGVRGNVARKPVGHFTYDKEIGGSPVKVRVAVFPLKVRREDPEWKEDSVRQRMWLPQMDAADAVSDPELGELLRVF